MICKQCNEWFEDPRHIPNNLRPQDYPKVNVFTNKCDLHEVLNLKTLSNIKNTGDQRKNKNQRGKFYHNSS